MGQSKVRFAEPLTEKVASGILQRVKNQFLLNKSEADVRKLLSF